jgi:hypothetical protein
MCISTGNSLPNMSNTIVEGRCFGREVVLTKTNEGGKSSLLYSQFQPHHMHVRSRGMLNNILLKLRDGRAIVLT